MNTNFIIHEPAGEYHARSRSGEFMSSHLLADFCKSPVLYYKKVSGQIEEKDSSALAFGRAAHCLILEGKEAFDRDYIVSNGPINPHTGKPFGSEAKAFKEWLAEQNRELVSTEDYGYMLNLRTQVLKNPAALELLSAGSPEGVVRTEYCGVPCQIRMDWFSPEKGLVDLKTCSSLDRFGFEYRDRKYGFQMAFYRAIIRQVTGITVPVHMIAVEKCEPFSSSVKRISDEKLDEAESINEAALARYKKCLYTGVWPTGYEGVEIIDFL